MRLLNIFPTIYHLYHFDEQFRKYCKSSFRRFCIIRISVFSKLIKNCEEFDKKFNMKNLRNFNIFPTDYHLYHLGKPF